MGSLIPNGEFAEEIYYEKRVSSSLLFNSCY